jgi:hypothetical protein
MRIVVLLLACGLCSCSAATVAAPVENTYVGTVSNTDVAVGLVSDGSHVAMFFCGGPTSLASSTKWLRFADSTPNLHLVQQGWTIDVSISGDTANGTVDRGDGRPVAWSATRAPSGSVVGLYGSSDATGTSGVVVTDPLTVTGAFIETKTAAIQQIIPIMPLQRTAAGLHVTVAAREEFVPAARAQ